VVLEVRLQNVLELVLPRGERLRETGDLLAFASDGLEVEVSFVAVS